MDKLHYWISFIEAGMADMVKSSRELSSLASIAESRANHLYGGFVHGLSTVKKQRSPSFPLSSLNQPTSHTLIPA